LGRAIDAVPFKQKLLVLGNFNARVGRNHELWHKVLGRHGIGSKNGNGSMLLDLCTKQRLVITNTVFQQANKLKASWMHPRSKHWHLMDYVLTRQRDLRDIRLTRVMRPTTVWSDHRMVRTTVLLKPKPVQRKHRAAPSKKFAVAKLKEEEVKHKLQNELAGALSSDDTDQWPQFKAVVYNTATKVIGFRRSHKKDWFDDQDTEVGQLLDDMHGKHLAWVCSHPTTRVAAPRSPLIQLHAAPHRKDCGK